MKILDISGNKSLTDNGAKSIARALNVLEELNIGYTSIGDEGVAHIANALSVNSSLEELDISGISIGDEELAHIANALQKNTTMKVLHVNGCLNISYKGAESLGRVLSVNSSLEELDISGTSIGDEGVAHIANALQTNTTMKVLDVAYCEISDKGAESIARALTASISLERLDISHNHLGDNGIVHIAISLQASSFLKSLTLEDDNNTSTVTDKAALSLAAALTTNTSMEDMTLEWPSTHPDTTLKKMAKCIKKSTLRDLELTIVIPQPLGAPQVSLEKEREWYQRVEEGGKELILSLEDSHLERFLLRHYKNDSSLHDLKSQICMSLKEAAASVNLKRKMNYLPKIKLYISVK